MSSLVPVLQVPMYFKHRVVACLSENIFQICIAQRLKILNVWEKYVSLENINPVRCNFEKVEWGPRSRDDVFAKGILAIDAHNGQWDLILPIFWKAAIVGALALHALVNCLPITLPAEERTVPGGKSGTAINQLLVVLNVMNPSLQKIQEWNFDTHTLMG